MAEMTNMRSEVADQVKSAAQTQAPESIDSSSTRLLRPEARAEQPRPPLHGYAAQRAGEGPAHFKVFDHNPPTATIGAQTTDPKDRVNQLVQQKAEIRSKMLVQGEQHRQQFAEILLEIERELQLRDLG